MTTQLLEQQAVETPEAETPEVRVETPEADPLASYEAELGITVEAPATPQAPSTPTEPTAEILAAAETLRAREREDERRQREENGLLTDYRSRRDRIAAHLAEVQAGRQQVNLQAILTEFDRHNGQAGEVARRLAAKQYTDALYKAAEGLVPDFGKDRTKHTDTPAMLKDLATALRKDYQSKADVEKAVKAGKVEIYNKIAKDPAALPAMLSKIEGSAGAGGPGETITLASADRVLDNVNATEAQRRAAFVKKHGFDP